LIRELTERFLTHEFDLLGSEWVTVSYGRVCAGLEGHRYPPGELVAPDRQGRWLAGRVNPSNLAEAQAAWQLIPEGYRPIDWQLDFKSGFRWSPTTPAAAIRYGDRLGADVKVPWELARMQHLPQLVWAYVLAAHGEPGFLAPQRYAEEIEHQVLDFIATNPPRFGVNWSCTMDVAIRIANWLVAHDLLRDAGWVFRPEFEVRFIRSVYDHGRHVSSHLEWHPTIRANHYLADIVGLLFAAAYLPESRETNAWLECSIRELVHEVGCQFTPDGANFEASTSYHRLSSEMVLYASAIVLALSDSRISSIKSPATTVTSLRPGPPAPCLAWHQSVEWCRESPFPEWYIARLKRMAAFTACVIRSDGSAVQIGDNDSGRFLKLWPRGSNKYNADCSLEEPTDHRHLLAAVRGLFGASVDSDKPEQDAETEIVNNVVWNSAARDGVGEASPVRSLARSVVHPGKVDGCCHAIVMRVGGAQGASVSQDTLPELQTFPDFGLYVYRTGWLILCIRCGPVGQNGNGGHAHNDQLSFELAVDGISVLVDPGTYVYTPLPAERNRFRSTSMHNTLSYHSWEQNSWEPTRRGLFALRDICTTRVLMVEPAVFVAEVERGAIRHRRTFRLTTRRIDVTDECQAIGEKMISFHFAPQVAVRRSASLDALEQSCCGGRARLQATSGRWSVEESSVSSAYGRICTNQVGRLHTTDSEVHWHWTCEE
jgi:hypothetical protein